jgi:hypothetical protein
MKVFLLTLCTLFGFFTFGQNCDAPQNLSVQDSLTTLDYDWKKLRFHSVSGAEEYRVRFMKITASSWEYRFMNMDTVRAFGFELNETYVWGARAWCDTTNSIASAWSVQDTFSTNTFVPAPFSPSFSIDLSHYVCDSLSDLQFTIAQDPNEADIASSAVFSSSGSFPISSLSVGQTIGYADVMAGGGFYEYDYTLLVDQIISSNVAIIAMQNDSTAVIDASFTIENDNGGIKILNTFPADGNNYTSGNYSIVFFENLFLNPAPSTLEFYTSIQSELGDNDTQSIDYMIDCLTSNREEIQPTFIYPNPATDHLNFDKSGSVILWNANGQKVLQKAVANYLNVSNLERGLYFMHYQSNGEVFKSTLLLR